MRDAFHADIEVALGRLVDMGATCDEMLEQAVQALTTPGAPGAHEVMDRDNTVDRAYRDIQRRALELLALQAPVAGDLRLLTAVLHVNVHVERLGDYATSVARTATRIGELAHDRPLASLLTDMASAATAVSRSALRSFANRDVEQAYRLPALDDRVDQRYLDVFRRLIRLAGADEQQVEPASRLVVVARSLERYGDHAVDIGEQTVFAVTADAVELSTNDPGART